MPSTSETHRIPSRAPTSRNGERKGPEEHWNSNAAWKLRDLTKTTAPRPRGLNKPRAANPEGATGRLVTATLPETEKAALHHVQRILRETDAADS